MKKYMNKPIEYSWTNDEIRKEYEKCPDKKKIAKIFCIEAKDLNRILKG